MKSLQSTSRIIFVEDLVQQLNQEVTKSHQNILQTSVLFEAKNYADKNLPKPEEKVLDSYLTAITGQYKALRKDVALKLQGSLQKFLGVVGIAPIDEKINTLTAEMSKEADKIKNLETDKARMQLDSKHTGYKKHKWLLILFGLAESLLTMSCFLNIGDIVLIALVLGVVVGLAQIYAAKTTVLFVREVENVRIRRRYWIIALIGFTIFSIVLGSMRYYFAHKGAASDVPFIILNPFSFAAINMLLIIASALLVYFFFPSKTELEQVTRIENIEKEVKISARQKDALLKQHDALVKEKTMAVKIHGEMAHGEKELFEKIDAFFDEAVGKFKHENVTKRTDGAYPECFKHPHAILSIPNNK